MRLLYVTLILALLTICSCNTKNENEQKMVIQKDKMVEVIYDLHLGEAIANYRSYDLKRQSKKRYSSDQLFKSVLKKHNITLEVFENSLIHYARNIRELDAIYQRVMNKMNTEKELLEQQNKPANVDSLKNESIRKHKDLERKISKKVK